MPTQPGRSTWMRTIQSTSKETGRMHFTRLLTFVIVCPVMLFARQNGIHGFLPDHLPEQRAHEASVLSAVSELQTEQYLFDLTKEPHHAGSAGGRRTAEYVQKRFAEAGFDSKLQEYHVLLPYPRSVKISILEPIEKDLHVKENIEFHPDALIPFNAYSPSGDVTALVVYANYALAADFERLKELAVDVKGKIVIARYGQVYRGLKVLEATKAGAIGIILYSDPEDDGFMKGDVYPKGRMRPWDGVQRGSIRFAEVFPGDPLTPGVPATKNAKRIRVEDDADMPRIPCTPISYGQAQEILRTIEGPVVPEEWQGGLPFAYHIGPGPTTVRLQIDIDYAIRPVWNNIAVIEGSEEPDQWIILGGHRDGWVFGAQDPNGGSAVLLEAARVIGKQVKAGWKPRRTLVFAQWDAEEYGLIGSTEWGEEFRDELKKKAVVYMNFDGTVSGPTFGASSNPLLDNFLRDLTEDVNDPAGTGSVLSTWWRNQNEGKGKTIPETAAVNVGRLGGGSDHVVFQNHLGIPSLGFGFGGPNGIYHSYYDTFDWMKRFGDPGFRYHAASARLATLAAMRMANADILPFTITPYADEILEQLGKIEKPYANSWPASASLSDVRAKAGHWKSLAAEIDRKMMSVGRSHMEEINDLLLGFERLFVLDQGLPGREWYKHRIVVATGYESVGLPGINEAAGRGDWETVGAEIRALDSILDRAIEVSNRIQKLL